MKLLWFSTDTCNRLVRINAWLSPSFDYLVLLLMTIFCFPRKKERSGCRAMVRIMKSELCNAFSLLSISFSDTKP